MSFFRPLFALVAFLSILPVLRADDGKPAVDLFGDPLPPGAIARLGTIRLRYAQCMAFSPDGKIIATAQHHVVHLWDAATGKPLQRLVAPHSTEWAHTVAFSPDGRKLALLGNLGLDVVVWRVDRESPLFTAHIKREDGVYQLVMARIVFAPDGKTLYTGNDQAVYGWDATTGKQTHCFQYSKEPETRANTIVFSRDGKRFATARDGDTPVRVWDTQAGKLLHVLRGHEKHGIYCAAFNHDGTLLATGGGDEMVRLWDVQSGKEVGKFKAEADVEGDVIAVAFTPDGKGLATARRRSGWFGGSIRWWDLPIVTGKPRTVLRTPSVEALEYSPDGKTLAYICCRQSVCLLDAITGKEHTLFDSHVGGVNTVAYSSDGRLIATGSDDETIRLWEADTGKARSVWAGHLYQVAAVAFSPDGKLLASASGDTTRLVSNVQEKEVLFTCEHGSKVRAVAFTPDGQKLFVGGDDYIIQSWDVCTGAELRRINEDGKLYKDNNRALAISPDGKVLASGGMNHFRLLDARNGKLLRTVKSEPWVTSLAFSPDGRMLAVGCMHWTILWELASGKERARLPGHWNQAGCLAFSPDGKLLASGSHDPGGDMNKVVHVWELARGKELGVFCGHEQPVFGVAFSPDSKHLATASGDATTLIWDLAAIVARGPHPSFDKRSMKSPVEAKDLEAAWNDLAGDDAVKAQQAVWLLTREARQGVAFLAQRLRPATQAKTERIAARIADLESESFSTRERASRELAQMGTLAEPLLRKKQAEKISLEMRQSIELLLEKMDVLSPLSGEELRRVRALEVLEQADTVEARQLLRTLAKGAEDARLTIDAKASLQRLNRRSRWQH